MRHRWSLTLLLTLFSLMASVLSTQSIAYSIQQKTAPTSPQRIISLAPSITEMLFAIGLEQHVVGVSNYCDYPSQVTTLPKVGGYLDTNMEAILELAPDLVILSSKQHRTIEQLAQLGITTLTVSSESLADIKDSIQKIGEHTHHQYNAEQLIASMTKQENDIANKLATTTSTPTVMVTIGHSLNNQQINTIYISGQHDFYNDLITRAGGINVYQNNLLAVPSLTLEGIIQLNPDIIIDIFPEANDHHYDLEQVAQSWQRHHYLKAVKSKQIYLIEQDFATIPGPRITQLLDLFARVIHPEIDWEPSTP